MKNLLLLLLAACPVFSFGQIGDPTPNLDIEKAFQNNDNIRDKWDFSKHPYKTITQDNRVIDRFDSIGRHTERTVLWNDFTIGAITKYLGDQIVESTRTKTYKRDANGQKKGADEIIITRLTLNESGRILGGKTLTLTKDSVYKVTSHQYYDKQNRLRKVTDSTGLNVRNFYYSGKNLTRIEEIQNGAHTKTVIDKTYKYNRHNQIVWHEGVITRWENNTLKEKRVFQTVQMEYEKALLVRKVLTDRNETTERKYAYDPDQHLITFIEVKKNKSDGMITSQVKRTRKYENNLLVYSEVQDGLSPQQGKFSFTYYFHSADASLAKIATTDRSGNLEVRYVYNDYGHLIQTLTVFSDTPGSQTATVYDIEYWK